VFYQKHDSGALFDGVWSFELGQCIDHVNGGMPSIVQALHWTGRNEVYGVRAMSSADPQRHRVMAADAIRHTRPGDHCDGCRLRGLAC
jgi:hypothetical protein